MKKIKIGGGALKVQFKENSTGIFRIMALEMKKRGKKEEVSTITLGSNDGDVTIFAKAAMRNFTTEDIGRIFEITSGSEHDQFQGHDYLRTDFFWCEPEKGEKVTLSSITDMFEAVPDGRKQNGRKPVPLKKTREKKA